MSGGPTEQETCQDLVLPRLAANGWEGDGHSRIVPEFPIVTGRGPGRLGRRRADYLLEVRPGLAGAVVEAKRAYATAHQGIQQAIDYAIRLDVPLAYATNGRGIVEHNRNTGVEREVDDFPTPVEVLAEVQRYSGGGSWPLLDLPFSRLLYLADRDALLSQPIRREFRPVFGEAVTRVTSEATTSREIFFASYQALDGGDFAVLQGYPRNFFDLVIVDECHCGSAEEASRWRKILEYFSTATQIGLTATPRRDTNGDTYDYFGAPVFEYSLRQGIEDGYLAPYRVRRVVLSPDAQGWRPDPGQRDRLGREIPDRLYTTRQFERLVSLLLRTRAVARYLTDYLHRTDRMGRMLVFCANEEHATALRRELMAANTDLVRRHPEYVARIMGVDGEEGKRLLEAMQDGADAPVIAVTTRLLSTGVDIPDVRTVVLFHPVGSMVEFKQIIGRGTRLDPESGKWSFDIIDFIDATRLFDDTDFDGDPIEVTRTTVDSDGEVTDSETARRNIDLNELLDAFGLTDHDPLDALIRLTYREPVPTRQQRADRVCRTHADELASQQTVARSVLTALLDQYARQGPQVLDDLRALELQPFRQYGSLIDIASYFGGGQGLRDAMSLVGSWIYSA